MAFIYKITNDINDKVYIGKTLKNIEKRWKEHLRDYKKQKCEKRPLYSAMKKYGVEHFSIEVVEECSMEAVSDREIYWITYFNSYKNGYNATRGGDGKSFIDTNAIQTLWLSNKSLKEIQELTGYCKHTIRNVLYQLGVDKSCIMKRSKKNSYKAVNMYSKEGNLLMTFPSIANAIDYLKSNCIYKVSDSCCGHISSVCLGKRATAYGYRWEYK